MAKILGPFDHLKHDDLKTIFQLWNSEYPKGISYQAVDDLKNFLRPLGKKHHYLIRSEELIIAWLVTFDRANERWFSIIVDPQKQGQGYGRKMIQHVLRMEPILNGWVVADNEHLKIDGRPYSSPISFYSSLGFKIDRSQRLENEQVKCIKISTLAQ